MIDNIPIIKRTNDSTKFLQNKVDEYIKDKPVGISKINVGIKITTPFPTLSSVSQSNYVPIIDPDTIKCVVEDNMEDSNEKEIMRNAEIIFEQQALEVIEKATESFIDALAASLQDYFPQSSDFEEIFKTVIKDKKLKIDSLFKSNLLDFENDLDDKFNEITKNIEKNS
jgi:hypothetical protein